MQCDSPGNRSGMAAAGLSSPGDELSCLRKVWPGARRLSCTTTASVLLGTPGTKFTKLPSIEIEMTRMVGF